MDQDTNYSDYKHDESRKIYTKKISQDVLSETYTQEKVMLRDYSVISN